MSEQRMQPQAQSSLTQLIQKHEFRDGSIALKLADGREVVLPLREFIKMETKELAARLGLEGVPLKSVLAWKYEVLQSYLNAQPLRRQVEFARLEQLWTLARPILIGDEWVDEEREFTVWFARQSFGASAAIIDVDGYVNPRRLAYSLVKADEGLASRVVGSAPRSVLRRLLSILEERGVTLDEGEEGGRKRLSEEELRHLLVEKLLNYNAIFAPAPTLRDAKFLENIDWREYVEELLTFGAPVDSRLVTVRAVYALRGVEGRYLPHGLLVANSGSGKSQFFKVWGQHWDKVTANTLIGYAKGKDEIYPGLIDNAEEVIAVDQVESADRANLTRYLLDYMEDGACSFAAGGVSYKQKGLAPFVFIANPLGSGGEKDFQRTLEVVSYNPALGGRIAIIFYFTDLAVIRGTKHALSREEEEEWRRAKALVRAVEDYCRGRLRAIWRHPKVVEWLKQPITLEEKDKDGNPKSYAEKVKEIVEGGQRPLSLSNEQLYEFFMNHATQAASKIRAAALQAALLFNLKDIALNTYTVEKILEEAEEWLQAIVELNLASIANIVADYEGKREQNVKAIFESLPDYLKAIVVVAEAYRRAVLNEYRGRGQVPEELRDLVLSRIGVSIQRVASGYRYLSDALSLARRRKGALERLNAAGSFLKLKFTLLEQEKQLKVTVLDWEEQPIPVPEELVSEVAEVLKENQDVCQSEASGVGHFGHSVTPSERGSQPPHAENPESIPSGPAETTPSRNSDRMTEMTEPRVVRPTNQAARPTEDDSSLKENSGLVTDKKVEGGATISNLMPVESEREGSDQKAGKEKALTQVEIMQRILEFVGGEGKPLREVLEYAVKRLGLKKPEPLLKELLERGHLVKVKKGDETWLVKG